MKKLYSLMVGLMLAASLSAQNVDASQKVSPALGQLLGQQTEGRRAAQAEQIELLAKLADGADEDALARQYGFEILRRIGQVLVLRMPLSQVAPMAANEQVVRLEAERMPRPMLDQVPQLIGSDRVNTGSQSAGIQAYTGKGVVVGIVDAGFDYINPMFRDSEGKTRIVWAADYMKDITYTTRDEVTAAMHSSDATTQAHGTHVTGIAAGSRVNDTNDVFYQGMAPEADIAQGAVDAEISSKGLNSTQIIKAFSDIFALAKEQNKPCVINFSMGEAMSFSDSHALHEEAIRTLLSEPGRAIVVASGNSGGTSRLAYKPESRTQGGCGVCFNDFEQYGTYFGIEVKMKPTQALRLQLTNSTYTSNKGDVTKTATELASLTDLTLASKNIKVTNRGTTKDGYVVLYLTAGLSTYELTDRILVTIEGEGEAWIYADALCAQLEKVPEQYVTGHDLALDGYSMAWPAQMPEVITVGNIAHRLKIVTMANKYASHGGVAQPTDFTEMESTKGEGYLARSSSVGPTLDGGMKPDVCAPGVNIISAQNFFIDDATYMNYAAWDMAALDTEYETWGKTSGYFHMMAQIGTSMSAPAVTGTIALWMQADPTLTTERIKDIMAHSCRQPDSELTYPNNQYGYGEIDAFKGLCYILGVSKIEGVSTHQPQQAQFQLNGRQLTVQFATTQNDQPTLRVYSTDGRLVATTQGTSIDLSGLRQGVYAVQLSTGNSQTTGATLIRL